MSVKLPPTIALKSASFKSYMNYCRDSEKGFLRFIGDNVFSSLAKFQVVQAKTGRSGLVHVRCAHNQRFVRIKFEGGDVLSAEADEPEEDQSKWWCTLFEPQAVDGDLSKIRFIHVQTKLYATAWEFAGFRFWKVHDTPNLQNIYDITNLKALVMLPKYLAFVANNQLYLQQAESNQLRFISTDMGIPESWFEVFTDGDGMVTIKVFNSFTKNYLRLDGDDIFADGDPNSSSKPPSVFLPVRRLNAVHLICLTKTEKRYCRRSSVNIDCRLSALPGMSSVDSYSGFYIEELVNSRRIYDTVYYLKQKVIYNETPILIGSRTATNATSAENTMVLEFLYKQTKTSMWSSIHSWMLSPTVNASFSIPFIDGTDDVTVSGLYSGSYYWGSPETSNKTLETTYTVTVPAHTTVTVSMMATEGTCDVPFSYYLRDELCNGKIVTYKKDDGMYTGVNAYNFQYKVTSSDSNDLPKVYPVPLSHIEAASNLT